MVNMEDITELLFEILRLADLQINENQIKILDRGCPHNPSGLPYGQMGVYLFKYQDEYLKIGKAGPSSNARFQSQHYSPNSSQSNLAKFILHDPGMVKFNLNSENVGNWIKQNVQRIDVLIDSSLSIFVLELVEAFLHCKLKPKYEGFSNQKK
jgi:hypothetical protein